MKIVNWKMAVALSCAFFLLSGSSLWAQPAVPVNFEETDAVQQPVVSVDAIGQPSAVVVPSSPAPADTLTFLAQNSPLAKTDTVAPEPALVEVPEGWTRAASNENFVFKSQLDPHTARTVELHVMDLRTGDSRVVGGYVPHTGARGFGFIDVSPDQASGKVVAIFEVVNSYAGTSEISFVPLDGIGASRVLTYQEQNVPSNYDGILDSVEYSEDGGTAYLSLGKIDGTPQWVNFDLGTLQVVPPSRWTRAVSNENFAFLEDFRCSFSGCVYPLSMLNLQTGAETLLSNPYNYFLRGVAYHYDVSPDGNTLIYSIATSSSWEGNSQYPGYTPIAETYVKSLTDPTRYLRLDGAATSIQFTSSTEAIVTIGGRDIRVDLQNMRAFDPRNISATTTAALTDFTRYQITPLAIGDMNQTAFNLRQTSSGQFTFDYDVTRSPVHWAAAMFLFNGERFDATASDIVLEANIAGASYYKLELEDQNNLKTVFHVTVTNGRIQVTNAMIQAVGVAGFDAAHLKAILMTVDDPSATTGSMTVKTCGLVYRPAVNGSAYNLAAVTRLPGNPILNLGYANSEFPGGSERVRTTQTSTGKFSFDYTLSWIHDFAFASLSNGTFDGSGSFLGTPMNLTSGVTLAVNGPAGKQLKVEFKDTHGKIEWVYLNLTGRLQNYTIPLGELNVDPANIGQIAFVAGQEKMGGSGTVQVEVKGVNYVPVISTATTAALTDFMRYLVTPMAVEPGPGTTVQNLRQTSVNQFAFDYNLQAGGASGHWAAVMLFFDRARLFNAKANDIVLGAAVTGAGSYKLELEDLRGLKTVFRVTVTNGKIRITNAMIQSAAPSGFDASRLKAIVMTVDDPQATRGSMKVNTGGLVSRSALLNFYQRFPYHSWQWWFWYFARRGF